jgi:hypothetical protein
LAAKIRKSRGNIIFDCQSQKEIKMGITVYYKGKVNEAGMVDDIVKELTEISEGLKWKYEIVNDKNLKVKGIIIRPHEKSETFSILANKNLNLISIGALHLKKPDEESSQVASIKTQYAPIQIHIGIIKLLKYLKKKYIYNLEVFDEGDYWRTMDENILDQKMSFLLARINLIGDILDTHKEEFEKLGSPEKVVEKIEELLKNYGFKRTD